MKIDKIIFSMYFLLSFPLTQADIRFEESTTSSGIDHRGQTYGASWGDFNGDGWPDIWVGNHNSKPNLYLNNRDGTFTDIIEKVWSANPLADTHGAAWADFDNDGDQDLIELVGASFNKDGTLCFGCGPNHLFVNENGVLKEKAKEFGLDNKGFARSPVWMDANLDSKLDVVIVNTRSRKSSSAIFLNIKDSFKKSNEKMDFVDQEWKFSDKFVSTVRNLFHLKLKSTVNVASRKHLEFASLANINTDNNLDLILFSAPMRVFSLDDGELDDITNSLVIPDVNEISDAAIEDFNGDGAQDMYLTRRVFLASDVIQVSPNKIKGTLRKKKNGKPTAIRFHSKGILEFQVYPTWRSLRKFYIGADGKHPDSRLFSLSPEDVAAKGPEFVDAAKKSGISINYDKNTQLWTIRNYSAFVDFIISATSQIENLETIGFKSFEERGKDRLLLNKGGEYVSIKLQGDAGQHNSCHSVTAGDFDNDMDVDIYLLCTGPIENLPNRLLENDGQGNFHLVENAGGAPGSELGRGDVVTMADYNRDGFLDLFMTNGLDPDSPFVKNGPHQLYLNRGNSNNWIAIDLEGVKSNRDGIGANVIIETNGIKQIRAQNGGMHRIAQNFQRIHFGLGKHKKIDSLTIHWPSGIVQKLNNPVINQVLKIRESPESGG